NSKSLFKSDLFLSIPSLPKNETFPITSWKINFSSHDKRNSSRNSVKIRVNSEAGKEVLSFSSFPVS
ncbi:hypothetical protein, partial [Crocosphaera watsonii]|uniref:hypothetical protein n=1 Tax=Crocosphaera watsonii TaxID=263511 RepID=UPI001E42C18B